MPEASAGLFQTLSAHAPLAQLVLLAGIAAVLGCLLRELRRLRHGVFVFDNSVHERLRGLQSTLEAGSPARYALASFIAAQRTSGRPTAELRLEFEAMLGDLERLEGAVDDVLTALDRSDAERPRNGAGGAVHVAAAARGN